MKHTAKEIDYDLLNVSSPAFTEGGIIPEKYTCDGKNVNPPIKIDHIPTSAKTLAIIVEDPDAPVNAWIHWIIWNIPVTKMIKENSKLGTEGLNDFQHCSYEGPCPYSGMHRYHFKIYALDNKVLLPQGARLQELEKEMSGHILAFGEFIGRYKRG